MASEPFTLSGEPDAYDMAVEATGKAVQPSLFPPHLFPRTARNPPRIAIFGPRWWIGSMMAGVTNLTFPLPKLSAKSYDNHK